MFEFPEQLVKGGLVRFQRCFFVQKPHEINSSSVIFIDSLTQ